MRRVQGLTLIELMLTLAVMAIVLTLAIPALQQLVAASHGAAYLNELSTNLQYARHRAIRQRQTMLLCPADSESEGCGDSWSAALLLFADRNGNRDRDADEPLLRYLGTPPSGTVLDWSRNQHYLVFGANGAALAPGYLASNGTFTLCRDNGAISQARALRVSLQGRLRVARDSDGDGIRDFGGTALNCD